MYNVFVSESLPFIYETAKLLQFKKFKKLFILRYIFFEIISTNSKIRVISFDIFNFEVRIEEKLYNSRILRFNKN